MSAGHVHVVREMLHEDASVLARITLRGRGRARGVELAQKVFHVHEVRDGKVSRCRVFTTEAEARLAAGRDA